MSFAVYALIGTSVYALIAWRKQPKNHINVAIAIQAAMVAAILLVPAGFDHAPEFGIDYTALIVLLGLNCVALAAC